MNTHVTYTLEQAQPVATKSAALLSIHYEGRRREGVDGKARAVVLEVEERQSRKAQKQHHRAVGHHELAQSLKLAMCAPIDIVPDQTAKSKRQRVSRVQVCELRMLKSK
jgi:hypothetical protein